MCVFENVDMNCNACQKPIKEICKQSFSESLKDIIKLAVTETRWKTLIETYHYLCNIEGEIDKRYFREEDTWLDIIIEFIKDIRRKIEHEMDNEETLIYGLTKKIGEKESQRQMFTQEPKIDIPLVKAGQEKLCDTCNKADVCKYKDDTMSEVEKLFNVAESINTFIDVQVNCKKWSGTVNNVR